MYNGKIAKFRLATRTTSLGRTIADVSIAKGHETTIMIIEHIATKWIRFFHMIYNVIYVSQFL